jgi:GDSL-like lipase/acylhydrolase family protein
MADQGPFGRCRRILRGLGLQLAIALATLGAIELMLRAADLRFLRDGARPGYSFVYRYDPELGWAPVAHGHAKFTGSRIIDVQNNSIGLRDIEYDSRVKPTILFIGDSFTWGFDVDVQDRFTEILRRRMPQAEIVNAGVPGYGTDQEYLFLQRLWGAIEPDVVVLMVCIDNDHFDNSSNMRYDGYYKPYLAETADGTWRFDGTPVPRSRRVYFADNWLARHLWLARVAISAWVQVRHRPISVPDPTNRLISMMRAFVEARGAKFLVGLQRHELRSEVFLKSEDIPYVTFDDAETFPDFGYHWTSKGQVVVADRLQSLLAGNAAAVAPLAPSKAP